MNLFVIRYEYGEEYERESETADTYFEEFEVAKKYLLDLNFREIELPGEPVYFVGELERVIDDEVGMRYSFAFIEEVKPYSGGNE